MINDVRRIILVNDSRLLLGMLRRVIEKARHLEVVGELADLRDLDEKITETNADWVIVNEERGLEGKKDIDQLMNAHPTVRFLTVTADGSQIAMKSPGFHEENLSGLSLAEILKLLARRHG